MISSLIVFTFYMLTRSCIAQDIYHFLVNLVPYVF